MGLRINVAKRLDAFTLEMDLCCPSGRIMSVVGPSGAGKTTFIRLLAGLERPDSGTVLHNGRPWVDTEKGLFVPPQKRKVGFVFQEYTLFPHLTLWGNVRFAAHSEEAAERYLRRFNIWELRDKKPARLSGGERQRGALAQALARSPHALLLDEPFSALDFRTRQILHQTLTEEVDRLAIPAVLVTHDLHEAHCLGHRILCLSQGRPDADWLEGWQRPDTLPDPAKG